MKLLKLFQYAYIVFGALFLYDGIANWSTDRSQSYISFLLAALAIFMFFFRKRFRKKIEERNNK